MDDEGNIKLPESTTPTTKPRSGVGGGGEIEDILHEVALMVNLLFMRLYFD